MRIAVRRLARPARQQRDFSRNRRDVNVVNARAALYFKQALAFRVAHQIRPRRQARSQPAYGFGRVLPQVFDRYFFSAVSPHSTISFQLLRRRPTFRIRSPAPKSFVRGEPFPQRPVHQMLCASCRSQSHYILEELPFIVCYLWPPFEVAIVRQRQKGPKRHL